MNNNKDLLTPQELNSIKEDFRKHFVEEMTLQAFKNFFIQKVKQENYKNIKSLHLSFSYADILYSFESFLDISFYLNLNDDDLKIKRELSKPTKESVDYHGNDYLIKTNLLLPLNVDLKIECQLKKISGITEINYNTSFYEKMLLEFLMEFPAPQLFNPNEIKEYIKRWNNYNALKKQKEFVTANIYNEETVSFIMKTKEKKNILDLRKEALIEAIIFLESNLLFNLQNKHGLNLLFSDTYDKEFYDFSLNTKLKFKNLPHNFLSNKTGLFLSYERFDYIVNGIFKESFVYTFPVFKESFKQLFSIDIKQENENPVSGLMIFLQRGEIGNDKLLHLLQTEEKGVSLIRYFDELKKVMQQKKELEVIVDERIKDNKNKLMQSIINKDIDMDELSSF